MEIHEIQKWLDVLPGRIYKQQKKTDEAKLKMEQAKSDYEVEMACAMLASQRPNATEKKAEAIKFTQAFKNEVIAATGEYEAEKAKVQMLDKKFDAIRSISSLEKELIKSKV